MQKSLVSAVSAEKDLSLQVIQSDEHDVFPLPRLWTREEYYRAGEKGIFHPEERLELIRGEVFRMSPQQKPHVGGVYRSTHIFEAMVEQMTDGVLRYVRSQAPVMLQNDTEPEPDIVVALGKSEDHEIRDCLSTDVLLLLEVSDATLSYYRNRKAQIYAEDGITDYWVLNLRARELEVRRDPQNGVYQTKTLHKETESVTPLFAPQNPVLVSDLLPRAMVP